MKITICLLVLCLTGCATVGQKVKLLDLGMEKQQVQEILGKPDSVIQNDNQVIWQYTNKLMSGWGYDKADYIVTFKDDKLTSHYTTNVRGQTYNTNFNSHFVLP